MKNKKTEVAFLRCDIMNLLVQGAKFSAQQEAGGYGTILGAQLACNVEGKHKKKIRRDSPRGWVAECPKGSEPY